MRVVYAKDWVGRDNEFAHRDLKHASMLVDSKFLVNRTGYRNKLNFILDPLPSDWETDKDFATICIERARELWDMNKPIVVMWSGGIDSTVAYLSLLETMGKSDQLIARFTDDSIKEFPSLYHEVIRKQQTQHMPVSKFYDQELFADPNIIILSGEPGDHLFGVKDLEHLQDIVKEPWEILYGKSFFELVGQRHRKEGTSDRWAERAHTELMNFFTEHTKSCPSGVETVHDLYWWINFTLKWQDSKIKYDAIWYQNFFPDTSLAFFDSFDFQRWAMTNKSDVKQPGGWETYKWPAKQLIYWFFPDQNYLQFKGKEPSLKAVIKDIPFGTEKAVKLYLEDGRKWLRDEEIPEDVIDVVFR